MKKKVDFMITAFRDGFQSVYGARVQTNDFIPAVEAAAAAGIRHFEAGGGARFQSLYFYCNEDAFDMMDRFRAAAGPEADLQTLARGVNVVGLSSQSSDMIDLHAKLFKKHGITTIRNFDALNDVQNLIYSGQCIHNAGLRHEVCVTMMETPPGCEGIHDSAFYLKILRDILDADIPFGSVCFKDASGTSSPQKVYETVKGARALLGDSARISFHTHETAGVSILQYKSALEAGVTQIDLALSPVSGGTSQPDIMLMYHALKGTEYDLGIRPEKIYEVEEVFKECMSEYFLPPEAQRVEPLIPLSPMPGGALTANTQMLRDNNLLDKYEEVIKCMSETVQKGGGGTSVTPVSQFYFQQAFNNVMFGPWKRIAEGYGKMVLGYFGKTPIAPDPEIIKICSEQLGLEPTTEPVLEINNRNPNLGIEKTKEILQKEGLPLTDENIFIAGACQEKGILFLKGKATVNVRKVKAEASPAPASSAGSGALKKGGYTVSLNGKDYYVELEDQNKASVNGRAYSVSVKEGGTPAASAAPAAPVQSSGEGTVVDAALPGLVLRYSVAEGDAVQSGQEILILESMKMETPIMSPQDGILETFMVPQGEQVAAGDPLFKIR